METVYLSVDPFNPEAEPIAAAAGFIERGELVAFPTETVYGVGALAYSTDAVRKIFVAKARPESNPLQVHISSFSQLSEVVRHVPADAEKLINRFWPGPLSIILSAGSRIPREVCGGTDTVGLRMPSHPVALALIGLTGPIAATSANVSGRPSPLSADDVRADLDGKIRAVLDAGRTGSGLESTVLNLCVKPYRVLRRGGVSVEEIEAVLGEKIEAASQADTQSDHYKVKTRVMVAGSEEELNTLLHKIGSSGGTVGIVYNNLMPEVIVDGDIRAAVKVFHIVLEETGFELYPLLRQAENQKLSALIFAPLPENTKGVTASTVDRILAAAHRGSGD